jgi:glyoxylase-like metal-dependent hydrolase (beta-lactamase superfamily II)
MTATARCLKVGDITIRGLSDGLMPVPPEILFPDVPPAHWGQYRARFPESFIDLVRDGRQQTFFNTNIGVFHIVSRDSEVICDTGLGPSTELLGHKSEGRLPGEMEAQGIDPSAVDTVFLTHLHADHIGWNMSPAQGNKLTPTFAKARYAFGRADWEHFTSEASMAGEDGPYTRRSAVPVVEQGRAQLMDGETALAPGITAIPTPGHTPGHMSLLIASRNERAIILGDLVGTPAQISEPERPYGGDADVQLGIASRTKTLDMAEREGMLVLGPHLSRPGWGRIVRFQGRRYWHAL